MWFDTTATDGEDLHVVGPTSLDSVDCRNFQAKGATSVAEDVVADEASIKGTASIGGDVSVGDLNSKGALDIEGSLDAENVTLKGTTRVVGSLRAEDLSAKGASKFGDVEVESLAAKGQVAAGTITAEDLSIHGVVGAERLEAETVSLVPSGGTSTVGAIVGSEVTVRRDRESERGDLEATRIEGETVVVEHTDADEIVGREVTVGPGSHVDLVRAEELDVHPGATVERTEGLDSIE